MSKNSPKDSRYWAVLVYPDSENLDPHWRARLRNTFLECAISPLHDKDKWESDPELDEDINWFDPDKDVPGKLKKPHYHVMMCWANKTTYANALQIFSECLGYDVKYAERIASAKGYYDYLTHKNRSEKYQYWQDNLFPDCYNGFDPDKYLSEKDLDQLRHEIEDIVFKENIVEYSDLLWRLKHDPNQSLDHFLSTHTQHFNALLKSRKWKTKSLKGQLEHLDKVM